MSHTKSYIGGQNKYIKKNYNEAQRSRGCDFYINLEIYPLERSKLKNLIKHEVMGKKGFFFSLDTSYQIN